MIEGRRGATQLVRALGLCDCVLYVAGSMIGFSVASIEIRGLSEADSTEISDRIDVTQASSLLMRLSEETRVETVKRLARLRQFSPEVAQKVSLVLNKRLEALGEQSRRAYAGFKGVADLLNQLEPNSSKAILEMVEKDDSAMALGIGVPENGIRELLGQLDKKNLATALRGASEDLKNLIFKSMSTRAVDMLKEDMEILGAVRSKDVHHAQQEIVEVARRLEAEGKLVLSAESQYEYVV